MKLRALGADVTRGNRSQCTPFYAAALNGHMSTGLLFIHACEITL